MPLATVELRQTLLRIFIVKMVNATAIFLNLGLLDEAGKPFNDRSCIEKGAAEVYVRLLITDFFVVALAFVVPKALKLSWAPLCLWWCKKKLGKGAPKAPVTPSRATTVEEHHAFKQKNDDDDDGEEFVDEEVRVACACGMWHVHVLEAVRSLSTKRCEAPRRARVMSEARRQALEEPSMSPRACTDCHRFRLAGSHGRCPGVCTAIAAGQPDADYAGWIHAGWQAGEDT